MKNSLKKHKRFPRFPLTSKPGAIVELDGVVGKVVEVVAPMSVPTTELALPSREPYEEHSYVLTGKQGYRWQPCSRCKVIASPAVVAAIEDTGGTWRGCWGEHKFKPSELVTWRQRVGRGKTYIKLTGEVFELVDPNQSYTQTQYWGAYEEGEANVPPAFCLYPSQVPVRVKSSYLVLCKGKMYWLSESRLRKGKAE